jgi:hypothetical protein
VTPVSADAEEEFVVPPDDDYATGYSVTSMVSRDAKLAFGQGAGSF